MSSQRTQELTTEQDVENRLDELHTQYYNDELSEDEYEDQLKSVLAEADSMNIDYQYDMDTESPTEAVESTRDLWEYWPYGLMALLLLTIPLTRGRTLIFLIPLVVIWFINYARKEFQKE